jgi:hypothetical protein
MDLIKATDIWLNHILSKINSKQELKYDGSALNGFKTGSSTANAHSHIMELDFIKNEFAQMTSDNQNEILIKILNQILPEEVSESIYVYINDFMLKNNLIITKTLLDSDATILSQLTASASARFNVIQIQPSQSSQNQLSQLIFQLNNTLFKPKEITLYDLQQTFLKSINGLELKLNEKIDKKVNDLNQEFNKQISALSTKSIESYETCSLEQLKELLDFRIDKLLRYQNSLSILKKHQEKKTVPSALFNSRFPKPHLAHNKKFIEGHDKIILEAQVKFLEFDIELHDEEIKLIESDINNIKKFINKFLQNDTQVSNIVVELTEKVSKKLKPDFDKSMQKCLNVKNLTNLDKFNKPKSISSKNKKKNIKILSKSTPVSLNNSNNSTSSSDSEVVKNNNNTSKNKKSTTTNNYNNNNNSNHSKSNIIKNNSIKPTSSNNSAYNQSKFNSIQNNKKNNNNNNQSVRFKQKNYNNTSDLNHDYYLNQRNHSNFNNSFIPRNNRNYHYNNLQDSLQQYHSTPFCSSNSMYPNFRSPSLFQSRK